MTTSSSFESDDLVLKVEAPGQETMLLLDFNKLHLSRCIALGLKRALYSEIGHNKFDTQRKAFKSLKLLSEYLHEAGQAKVAPLEADVIYSFAKWLDDSDRGPSAQVVLNQVKRMLSWCQRNTSDVISNNATFLVRRIRNTSETTTKKDISGIDLKAILHACYQEIGRVEKQFEYACQLKAGDVTDASKKDESRLIQELLKLGNGILPTQRVVNRSGNAYARRVEELGGHRAIAKILWLSPEAMLPFYIAVLVQTSGNPDSIKKLKRNCISPHPLRADLERVVWIKARSSKEQWADFPINRKWSAPNIIRRLMTINAELIPKARALMRENVFISHNPQDRRVSTPADDGFQKELRKFIAKYKLPHFHFKDLRRIGAVEHHRAAGTIVAAKNRLKHVSLQTTVRYTNLGDRSEEHERVINRFQGEILRLSMDPSLSRSQTQASNDKAFANPSYAADTVFGFSCRDPFSGLAKGSSKGNLCLQFSRCATCPGALVPLDNPNVVAKLLATSTVLEEAKQRAISEGWWPRYELLYEPTRDVLVKQLLPAVHPVVREVAATIDLKHLIPTLE